jgi:hypothetical protein
VRLEGFDQLKNPKTLLKIETLAFRRLEMRLKLLLHRLLPSGLISGL